MRRKNNPSIETIDILLNNNRYTPGIVSLLWLYCLVSCHDALLASFARWSASSLSVHIILNETLEADRMSSNEYMIPFCRPFLPSFGRLLIKIMSPAARHPSDQNAYHIDSTKPLLDSIKGDHCNQRIRRKLMLKHVRGPKARNARRLSMLGTQSSVAALLHLPFMTHVLAEAGP